MRIDIPLPAAYVLRSHDPAFGGAISYMLIGMVPPHGVMPKITKPKDWEYRKWLDGRNAWFAKLPPSLSIYEHIGKHYQTTRTVGELMVYGRKPAKSVRVKKVTDVSAS